MKNLIITILLVLTIWFGIRCSKLAHKCPEPRIRSIFELQEAVGANPDGIVGPNTIAKWDRAYANQEAAKFFTPSGKPKE